eukprot:GHUV01045962.1.p1 GENE.GHUV01045962.1~~GHUV01045962.1.p1  ORF type:complete len:107 (+),score=25.84 GHUV01045962.1:80-400(+)
MGNTAPSRKTSQASKPLRRSTRIAMRKQSEARSPQRPSLHQQLPASSKTRKRKQANHAVESPQAYNKKLKKVPSLSGLWSLLPQVHVARATTTAVLLQKHCSRLEQ